MQSIKPTTIITLDAHAAAFCAATRERLRREFGTVRDSLTRAYALVARGEEIRFEPNLAAVADGSFDLEAARADTGRLTPQEAAELFGRNREKLEAALADILSIGRRVNEIDEAARDGIQIVDESTIYLLMSAPDPVARGLVLELDRALKKVLTTRFVDEVYTLHAIVLLPDLFKNPAPSDFAGAYALLKRLDHAALEGVRITPRRKLPSFDSCWLLDGRNASATLLGTLAEQLGSYADAFVGFLTADPERSGAAPGYNPQGRPPAYNSFGYGELFFPAEVAVARLSAALAHDIITRAFVGENPTRPAANERKLLVAAKQFVLSKEYEDTLSGIESNKGALIWRDFRPRAEAREIAAREYVAELQRRHKEFDRKDLLEFRETLIARAEEVRKDLVVLLDDEIDVRCDASPDGLYEALKFLGVMTDPAIAIQEELLGESPQNIITERRAAEGVLDQRLGIVPDHQATTALLEQVFELRANIQTLQTSLRLAPLPAGGERGAATTTGDVNLPPPEDPLPLAEDEGASAATMDASVITAEDDQQRLLEELEANERQLQTLKAEYPRVLDREDRALARARREARKRVEEEKAAAVVELEAQTITLSDQLQETQRLLDELKEERREYLKRMLVVYPFIALIISVVVALLPVAFDLAPLRDLIDFFWDNLWDFVLWIAIAFAVYIGVVMLLLTRDINRRIKDTGDRVAALTNSLNASIARLRSARNDVLRFEYEQFAQGRRTETLDYLLDMARQRSEELSAAIDALKEQRDIFARQRMDANPLASIMRRPLMTAEDIDVYYQKVVADLAPIAGTFTAESVARSYVRRITPEEFRARLMQFTRARFTRLMQLSIEDALLRERDLIPTDMALTRLRELNKTAEPLLRLRDADSTHDKFAERDVTLWASGDEHEQILSLYHRIAPKATARASDNTRTLRVLTRCHYFPAYFLGAIEHYRSCYEREPEKDAAEFSDLIPLDPEIKRAQEQLLLALALGLVTRRAADDYVFADAVANAEAPDGDHGLHAEDLATNFDAQKHYDQLLARIEKASSDHALIHQKLIECIEATPDLSESERGILNEMAQKYHPLR
ncbi:MAG TPA: hypothetical protein VF527_19365 [Pyrinomonadaceae bacterium]|jgi:low affinity Fe/Cu permease